MTADDLSAPLGQHPAKRRRRLPVTASHLIAAVLLLFLGVFVAWATLVHDPFGGQPIAVVSVNMPAATDATKEKPAGHESAAASPLHPTAPMPPANTKTITIIDGRTGEKQDVVIPGAPSDAAAPSVPPGDQKFVETTPQGPLPKIAADGVRPDQAFAIPVQTIPGKPDAPRIALIVEGLGINGRATSQAIAKLPGAVTLGFQPYGNDIAALVSRARSAGHEIVLQVPMEPFDYPDNDPGPQTLLANLSPEQNLDRLHWAMSRFTGYVGLSNAMGARFTASEQALAPVMRETQKRGLIFVDDGTNPRSAASQIAGANNLPFAKADITLDSVPTPDEIDAALGRLEAAAQQRGIAIGVASALPVAIDHIAKWAQAAQSRGFLLVPISAIALKPRQT